MTRLYYAQSSCVQRQSAEQTSPHTAAVVFGRKTNCRKTSRSSSVRIGRPNHPPRASVVHPTEGV